MSEKHIAYRINLTSADLACIHSEFEENKMLDLLKEIKEEHSEGIFWIFKQFDNHPKEPLCIIDCHAGRIYYHYSGEVDDLQKAIENLTH